MGTTGLPNSPAPIQAGFGPTTTTRPRAIALTDEAAIVTGGYPGIGLEASAQGSQRHPAIGTEPTGLTRSKFNRCLRRRVSCRQSSATRFCSPQGRLWLQSRSYAIGSCRCSRMLLTPNSPGRLDDSGGVSEIMTDLFFMLQDFAEFLNDAQQLIGILCVQSGAAQFSPVLSLLFSHGSFLRRLASCVVLRTLPQPGQCRGLWCG
jgi:hypothetical protein